MLQDQNPLSCLAIFLASIHPYLAYPVVVASVIVSCWMRPRGRSRPGNRGVNALIWDHPSFFEFTESLAVLRSDDYIWYLQERDLV
jgi:hypothetical protein